MPPAAAANAAPSSAWHTGWTQAILLWVANGSSARAITVRPAISRYCLGPPGPARSPRPPATITAATVGFALVSVPELMKFRSKMVRDVADVRRAAPALRPHEAA